MSTVWVWLEHSDGKLVQSAREALAAAQALGSQVVGIIAAGTPELVEALAVRAGQFGAQAIIATADPTLESYRFEPHVALLRALVDAEQPAALLAGHTLRGREVLSGLAGSLGVGALTDCLSLEWSEERLVAVRPAYDGKVLCRAVLRRGTVQLATLRESAFTAQPVPDAPSPPLQWAEAALAEDAIATKVEAFAASSAEVDLTSARVIVAGGRGVGGPEGFGPLEELASVLGGAVGASRAAVDAGWIPYAHQIGQTGKDVSPELYFAVGISGAIQHVSGMRSARTIVAINKDPNAPIFEMASYGLQGDLHELIPAITQALRAQLADR
ncbi:MAG: electron transfer flavoprotein subunit alpha/FixB family protein [Anaerolineae bacterium]|nr:electron transfer flavoprotein subunit alpha/FixB family protein [Anaerolineae bacterium]